MRLMLVAALALSLSLFSGANADELKSGPGAKIGGAFQVKAITGEKAGDTLCYVCKFNGEARPAVVLIFTQKADENLANVTEAYARGAVSVTDLIDAQEIALVAGLSASDARYGFLTDFVNMLRSMGEFEILLDPASREAWYTRVETWFREHPPQ